jgi:hypothetical protein
MPAFVLKAGRADEATQPELLAWLRGEFEAWRATDLPGGSRVEFYEGPDHYFQAGFVPATPLALYFGGNVAPSVIGDVGAWIHSIASG